MQYCDIPSEDDPQRAYLRRLRIVQTPWCNLYLHWINEPDADRHPHDHPWRFWSLVLYGGYTERVHKAISDTGRLHNCTRWSLHSMPIDQAHQITLVLPNTLTLILTGRRRRVWRFWTEHGKVPWREYLGLDTNRQILERSTAHVTSNRHERP
jgi:hypothetical protein